MRAVRGLGFRSGTRADHPYVAVGDGPRTLVVVPGLNDPLCRVTDARWFAALAAAFCGKFADDRAVAMVSRPPGLPAGHGIRDMADGYARVLDAIGRADVMGLSMGGFVVHELAVAHPERVDRAIFALAADRLGPRGRRIVERWRGFAERDRWSPIFVEAARLVASGARRPAMRALAWLYARSDPLSEVDREDFLITADAALAHDGRESLRDVDAPTLVVGGTEDPFFGEAQYRRCASEIPEATLRIVYGGGHDVVLDRGRAFDDAVRAFLRRGG